MDNNNNNNMDNIHNHNHNHNNHNNTITNPDETKESSTQITGNFTDTPDTSIKNNSTDYEKISIPINTTNESEFPTISKDDTVNNTLNINIPPTTYKATLHNSQPAYQESQFNCWAQLIGYSCCKPEITIIYASDEYGDWSYDFDKNEWCGLTPHKESDSNDDEACWSQKFGYPCCRNCTIVLRDSDGLWGYESPNWCGIPTYC
ncbi:Non-catalytic module family DOC2 [Piromyces sp. E2]|nr:Non-catalytic module family DOC2 [Piromyces sp. E2]|eukprot:OUM59732.1 Non-catalytic module family DOC2 [Piromyces sp. E2]